MEQENLSPKAKNRLQAVLRMEQVAGENNVKHCIDKNGAVVFTLPKGGTIRDSGKDLLFSAGNKDAEALAMRYAKKKWGRSITLSGNRIERCELLEKGITHS